LPPVLCERTIVQQQEKPQQPLAARGFWVIPNFSGYDYAVVLAAVVFFVLVVFALVVFLAVVVVAASSAKATTTVVLRNAKPIIRDINFFIFVQFSFGSVERLSRPGLIIPTHT
jgi:hypothetical protein